MSNAVGPLPPGACRIFDEVIFVEAMHQLRAVERCQRDFEHVTSWRTTREIQLEVVIPR